MRTRLPRGSAAVVIVGASLVIAACADIVGFPDVPSAGDAGSSGSFEASLDDGNVSSSGSGLDSGGSGADGASESACAVANLTCPAPSICATGAGGAPQCVCPFGWTGDGASCVNDGPTCDGSPGSCVPFAPTGGLDPADLDGDGLLPLVLYASATDAGDAGASNITLLDVDTGQITRAGVVIRPASSQSDLGVRDVQDGIAYRQTNNNIAVFTFRELTVPQGAIVRFTGTRAVALASATTMEIDGLVDARPASADGLVVCPTGGLVAPGAFAGGAAGAFGAPTPVNPLPGQGPGAGGASAYGQPAGGGGGHSAAGGPACYSDASQCAAGGLPYDIAALDANHFHGGSGGGGGAAPSPECNAGAGGGGGGAVRLVAVSSIEVGRGTSYGGVNAGGCGGGQAPVTSSGANPVCGGGGGGSGGAIVIESPRVQFDSFAALNASGGGAGSYYAAGAAPELTYAGGRTGCPSLNPVDQSGSGGGGDHSPGIAGENTNCAGGGAAGWISIVAGGGNPSIKTGASFSPDQASGSLTIADTAPAH